MNKEERQFAILQKAKSHEKNDDIELAINLYENLVQNKFDGSYPYDRLCILYRKNKDFSSEKIVLEKAIKIFTSIAKSGRSDGQVKLNKYINRLDSLNKKINKNM